MAEVTAKIFDFPVGRVRACLNPPEAPCPILILPVVRIERDVEAKGDRPTRGSRPNGNQRRF